MDPAKLREEALRLPIEARARLVADLLGSLDDEEQAQDPQAYDAAWSTEIAERLRAVDSGAVKPMSWMDARKQIVRED